MRGSVRHDTVGHGPVRHGSERLCTAKEGSEQSGPFSLMQQIVAYAQPDKEKSRRVLEAFAAGCGGRMASTMARELEPGDAAFYGVRPGWLHLWQQAKREGRTVWYIDNAYFDSCRERYFRITKNAIQHHGRGESDGKRFAELGVGIKPWRQGGDYALVCAQSHEFMEVVAGVPQWLDSTIESLNRTCERFVLRRKGESRPFSVDLQGARRLITWSSAAAVTALLEGVPVECSEQCAAYGVKDRQKWAEVLADNQLDLSEIRNGYAWKHLSP